MESAAEREIEGRIAELEAERERIGRQVEALRAGLAALRGEDPPAPARPRMKTAAIVESLAEGPLTRHELADRLGLGDGQLDAVSSSLAHLRRTGRVRRLGDGRWALPG
ncbi:hypothetical protein [Kribbella sp. NPDC051137]|uniref:hypothetical protein n=1 Tax=Kribbella sp. NPDC051137 TaxID=3155045 RepID=UPI0034317D66